MTRYQDIRLSKHFTMLDFMQDRALYHDPAPLDAKTILTDEVLNAGVDLCINLLEPLIEAYGPCSIAAGFCLSDAGHAPNTPHQWSKSRGAAADACFHDWVNLDRAPIKLAEDMIQRRMQFERLITYAGSEFICLTWKHRRRFALYENLRIPGQIKPAYIQHTRTMGNYDSLPTSIPDRKDWRRAPNEVVYHTRRSLRPQHVRLGRYFTLLDFCRSELGLSAGIPWVLPVQAAKQAWYGRMFAQILDPVVAEIGRICVTQGAVTPQVARAMGKASKPFHWTEGPASITFLLPIGADMDRAFDIISDHDHILGMDWSEHPSHAVEVTLSINPFTPKTIYSGGYPFGYYSGEIPAHLPDRVKARLQK